MAESPSFTTVPGRLPELLKRIRDTGVPPKATLEWLRSLGFKSSNDRTLLRVLRQIGFIDASGVPQPAWREYRGADHRQVLARALVLGYDMLYTTYADAHSRPATDLANVISTKTDAGKQTIDKTVATFKNLVKEADFEDTPSGPGSSTEATSGAGNRANAAGDDSDAGNGGSGGVRRSDVISRTQTTAGLTINVNVQLTLPETKDEKVFDAFFSAMRKHLIDDYGS